jgi:hypothetical protein
MEMITKMARLGEEIYSVPISYHARAGESNLRPIHDGIRILWMYARNLGWTPTQPSASPTIMSRFVRRARGAKRRPSHLFYESISQRRDR